MTLDQLRSEIREIDFKIIELIRKRVDVASEIGHHKQQLQLPVRNFQVEQEVIARAEHKANSLSLPVSMINEVMNLLIKVATEEQYKNRSSEAQTLENFSCLIIGGKGQMGSWLTMFFQTSGYIVETVDLTEANYTSLPDNLDNYDLILIATPMDVIEDYLDKLIDKNPNAVIADIGSLKSPFIEKLQECKQKGMNITSIHPMFGPEVTTLAGRNLIIASLGNVYADQVISKIFEQTAINIKTIPLVEHDKMMLYSLGLVHSLNLIFAMMIKESKYSFDEIMGVAGTTFLKQLKTTRELIFENPILYYQIQNLNKYKNQLFEQYRTTIDQLHSLINSEKSIEFENMFAVARDYFGGN